MTSGIRAFIGVELPQQVRQEVARFQEELKKTGADVRWTAPDDLHVTLKFLGNIDEQRISEISQALNEAAGACGPFSLRLEGIGAFPGATHPKILWVGVSEGKEELCSLAKEVEAACVKLGFVAEERLLRQAQDRPFSAHLTIGRVRSVEGIARLIKQFQVAEFACSLAAPVRQLVLFRSTPGPKGSTTTPLAQVPLRI